MQRRFGMMVGAVTLGFVGMLGIGSSAAAEIVNTNMQSGVFHIYEHDDFKGRSAVFGNTDTDLADNSWNGEESKNVNDNASSMKNERDRDVLMYENAGCAGLYYRAKKHSTDKDLTHSNDNPSFDNKASCVKFD
jgi:Peptidase inhibitor family I36